MKIMNNAKIMREAERCLKRTKVYQEDREAGRENNYQLQYVLSKVGSIQSEQVIAYAYSGYREKAVFFYPFRGDGQVYDDWPDDFENSLFELLEQGSSIIGMSLYCHSCVWGMIVERKGETEYKKGMQRYLSYCKRNGITKELLWQIEKYRGIDIVAMYSQNSDGTEKKMNGRG